MVFPRHFEAVGIDHPRRCQAMKRNRLGRCGNWALLGVRFCKFHNGRQSQRAKIQLRGMSRFYTKHMTATLNEAVNQHMGIDPDEQFQLFEELALMREMSSVHVALFGAAKEQYVAANNPVDAQQKLACVLTTGAAMVNALQQVGDVATRAAAIQMKQKDRYSIHDLKFVVDQLVKMLFEVCGDGEYKHIAEKFKMSVDNYLSIPTGYAKGVDSRPADVNAAVALIDSSVPYVPVNS